MALLNIDDQDNNIRQYLYWTYIMRTFSVFTALIILLLAITGCSKAEADVDYTNKNATIIDVRTSISIYRDSLTYF